MSRFILLVAFAVVAIVMAEGEDQDCGENEVYNSCGTACPEKCPYIDENGEVIEGLQPCVLMCSSGCFCKEGLIRDMQLGGECVEPDQCTPI